MPVNNQEIGERMRKLREDAGISLRALAKAMKYSAPYVMELELGKRNWSPRTKPNLQEFYLTTLENLKVAAIPEAKYNQTEIARDLKIKQIIICLDALTDDEIEDLAKTAEVKYLNTITDPEELKFYRETVQKIQENCLPLNREFIYS